MAKPADLPALSPVAALRAVAEATAEALARKRPAPFATVGLTSGAEVRGTVLRVEAAEGGDDVAVVCTDGLAGEHFDLAYLPAARIAHVVVHGADAAATALTGGKAARTDTDDAPTRLALRRWLSDELSPTLPGKTTIEASDEALGSEASRVTTRELAELVATVLGKIASDADGEAAAANVKTITLDQGDEVGAHLARGRLTVRASLREPLPKDAGQLLEDAISDVL